MIFQPEKVEEFKNILCEVEPKIKTFPGCLKLDVYIDITSPATIFTISQWEDEKSLENYRTSPLFENTWSRTKILFAAKPEAWSMVTRSASPA